MVDIVRDEFRTPIAYDLLAPDGWDEGKWWNMIHYVRILVTTREKLKEYHNEVRIQR